MQSFAKEQEHIHEKHLMEIKHELETPEGLFGILAFHQKLKIENHRIHMNMEVERHVREFENKNLEMERGLKN